MRVPTTPESSHTCSNVKEGIVVLENVCDAIVACW